MNDNKIVGGDAAKEGQFPFQVSFRYTSGFHFCGGAIYDEMTIITASHCCDGQDAGGVKIVAGELEKSVDSGNEQEVMVSSIMMHPEYSKYATSNA